MKKEYSALFFDLDHTLWDYDTNSVNTLKEIFVNFEIAEKSGTDISIFLDVFTSVNDKLWDNYNKGHIDRDVIKNQRFDKILKYIGIKNSELSFNMSSAYISLCPTKTALMPYAIEVLDYLYARYDLYLLTNGFNDVQESKVNNSKIGHYFKAMVTSETSGHRKPSMEIFQYTLDLAATKAEKTVMIGDNLSADIHGAKNASIDAIYYNPKRIPHKSQIDFEISCLSELQNLL